jgi:hypothetical protein
MDARARCSIVPGTDRATASAKGNANETCLVSRDRVDPRRRSKLRSTNRAGARAVKADLVVLIASRNADDPNEVVVLQDVSDVAKARTWLGSDDMKAAMQKSGAIGSPSIRFAA